MSGLIPIEQKIHEIRGQKVMLDFDLAEMYQTETRLLKRAVRRNSERFPEDFMFQLKKEEANLLIHNMVSQIGISKEGRGGIRYMPFAFTEQGVAMLSSVLHSEIAIKVNISIMRAFVAVRQSLIVSVSRFNEIEKLRNEIKNEIKLLSLELSEIHEDINTLNSSQENTDEQMEDLFQAFAKLSAQIQSKTVQLGRVKIEGFNKK
ncbi:hypothetical protein EZS27_023576 [termite gut metagenome]|uniref:KilA-N DNA-binding domain-containing protein n=1 Tax=termite gut metagenome TaxID=433724 RepID=A0A5J4R1G2_9ZZZZ